jgi:hypothetical protein
MITDEELTGWFPEAMKSLYWSGISELPWKLSSEQVSEFVNHLKTRPVFGGHVIVHGDGVPIDFAHSAHMEAASYEMESVVTAPHFFEWALKLTDVAGFYMGEYPRMYSCNAFWTRPGPSENNPHIQVWHRDRDDRKFVALFLYGTDVLTEEDGPHLFAKNSHRFNDGQNRSPNQTEPIHRVFGPAGTMFMANTAGLHMGIKPKSHERLLAWARWCVSPEPYSYKFDKLKPVPASKLSIPRPLDRHVESTSMVVDWNA